MTRIDTRFAETAREGRAALVTFVMGGDPDLETSTITYLVGSEKSPALLFENIKGHPGHRALYNMIGCNLTRFCLAMGEEPVAHPLDAVQILKRKMHLKQSPKVVPAEQCRMTHSVAAATNKSIGTRRLTTTCW